MHSFLLRGNAALTLCITVLATVCAVASLTDLLHKSSPEVHVEVLSMDSFYKPQLGNDEVRLVLNVTADLRSVFTWNTKQLFVFLAAEYSTPLNAVNQISLWDTIVVSKDEAKFSRRTRNKYNFIDQGKNLRGMDFNLTLYWNVMPLTGVMFTDKRIVSGFRLPKEYR